MTNRHDKKDTHKGERDIPTGRVRRFFKMGRLSSTVSTSYLGNRIRGAFMDEEKRDRELLKTHLKNAARMAETMGHLKGAVMKVGQMISMGDDELMPPEATEVLKVLQAHAPYLPFHRIRDRVEAELEGPLEDWFEEFEQEPMAAASLGQVHRGVLKDGMEVAVKVQYPDIDTTIHSDLANLKAMLSASGVFGRHFDLDPYFRELEEMLVQELDYVQEAVNLEEMRRLFGETPDITIPRYVPRCSTERVLTMEMAHGMSLDEFLATEPSQEARDRAGWALVTLIWNGFLKYRVLHADPQAGNFLFGEDGSLVLLDYGCIKRFEEPFIADYCRALKAHQEHDRETVIEAYTAVGYMRPDAGPRTQEALWEIADIYARPISGDRVYRFGSESLAERGKEYAMTHPACFNLRPPQASVYLHRTLVGAYFVLCRMGSSGNYFRALGAVLEDVMNG